MQLIASKSIPLVVILISLVIDNSMSADLYRSRISIFDLKDKSTKVIFTADDVWEAPNWSVDGKYLLVNNGGKLYRIALNTTGTVKPEHIDVGSDLNCNNDKCFSPDGKQLAFSASNITSKGDSRVYVSAADGSNRKLIVEAEPSYFHGWSPDGKWLAFVAKRTTTFNLFRVPVTGGHEQRLTSYNAYDDGPDYSPDGHWIYFNSNRSGTYDIWRMPNDGAGLNDTKAERVTSDELEDWFPHPSPDGKQIVFLSFPKGTPGHNDRMDGMELRLIHLSQGNVTSKQPEVLLKFYGGQGSINVNSWAHDSNRFSYVSYEKIN